MAKIPPPKKGRPTIFTPELGDFICEIVATNPKSLQALSQEFKEIPDQRTVNIWRWKHPDFAKKFNEAKEFQAQLLGERVIDIMDDTSNDYIENEEGKMVPNMVNIQRAKLQIDGIKFITPKLARKFYGDKVEHEHAVFSHDEWVAKFNGSNNEDKSDDDR